jgi:TrmH family RNA methyltransferase
MPEITITSRRHALVSRCRDAASGDGDEVLLEGPHLVAEGLAAGTPLSVILVGEGSETRSGIAGIVRDAARRDVAVLRVTPAVLDAASPTRAPAGVLALATLRPSDVSRLLHPPPPLVTVAIGVQDPGNVGTLVRTSEAAGATGVLAGEGTAHPFGWKALRGSMGSALRLPIARTADAAAELARLQTTGVRIVALAASADATHADVDLTGPVAICAGSEGAGLPLAVLQLADVRLRIPMRPPVESLNVAVATSLVLYEAMRQRTRDRVSGSAG